MAKTSKLTARDIPDGPNLFDDVPVVGWDKAEGADRSVTLRLSDIFGWDEDECDIHPVSGELLEAPCPMLAKGKVSGEEMMLQTPAPFSPFQGAEAMEWEKARTAFGHAVKAAGRESEILTYTGHCIPPGALDHRKLARLANSLLGRVASDKPEPTTEEWKKAAAALQGDAK